MSLRKKIGKIVLKDKGHTHGKEYPPIEDALPITLEVDRDLPKPHVGLHKDNYGMKETRKGSYWPMYRRYLEHNNIPYHFIDMNRSDWMEQIKDDDLIVWRTRSNPPTQEQARSQIYVIEKVMNKRCFPSFNDLWSYEDKVKQYYLLKANDLPVVDTFISNDMEESLEYIERCQYPFVSKIRTGSGSKGVELVKNRKEAESIVRKVFSEGRRTYWPYISQKDYVYFQKFIEGSREDMRVAYIDGSYFGFYKTVPEGDFRASGTYLTEKRDIKEDALELTKKVSDSLGLEMAWVDYIRDPKSDDPMIIEVHIMTHIISPRHLMIDDVPGMYVKENGKFIFKKGKYWPPEIGLNGVVRSWILERQKG